MIWEGPRPRCEGMLRELPLKTIGDIARHGLELPVYCPSCYATRPVSTDDTRWRDRLFATARFRCTGHRYTGRPCAGPGVPKIRPPELLRVGGPVTLAFLWCSSCIWEIDQAQLDKPPWSGAASAFGALAAVAVSSGTYMGQLGGNAGNLQTSCDVRRP